MSLENRTVHGYYDVQTSGSPVRVYFLGKLNLTRDRDKPIGDFSKGTLRGEIVDRYGTASINGRLDDGKLTFEKRYHSRKRPIIFETTRGAHTTEEDTFIGSYRYQKREEPSGNVKISISNQELASASLGINLVEDAMEALRQLIERR